MNYQKQQFSDGEVLQASHLNYIEDGIVYNEKQIKNINKTIEELAKELEDLEKDFNIEDITKELENLKKKIEELENSEKPNEEINKQIEEINNTIKLIQKEVASNKESLQDKLSNQQVNKLINDKYKEIVDLIPPEEIWRGSGAPPLDTNHILAISYDEEKVYFKDQNEIWKQMSGGTGEGIKSFLDIIRVSNENTTISAETEKCEISFGWTCKVNGALVEDKGTVIIFVNNVEKERFKETPGVITRDIKKHLVSGENSVKIKILDAYGSEEEIDFSINVVTITLTSSGYKQNTIISFKKLEEEQLNGIGLNITVSGTVTKTLHMLIDEEEYDFGGTSPVIAAGKKTITIYIPKQLHGSHFVELYATHTIINSNSKEEIIKSNSVFYDTIWVDDLNSKNTAIIASSYGNKKAKQYEMLKIPYYLYKTGYNSCDIRLGIKVNGNISYINEIPQSRETQKEFFWQISSKEAGQNSFIIEAGVYNQETQEFVIEDIREFDMELEAQNPPPIPTKIEQLSINFKAEKTDNFGEDKTNWESTSNEIIGLKANFKEGFDWVNNGWELIDARPALKIANGAKLEIPYAIFKQDKIAGTSTEFSTEGVTIEIDVGFEDIVDSKIDFLTCFDENTGKGIKISPSRAILSNGINNPIQVQYASSESKKYNNSMRFSFVICPIQTRYKANGAENDKLGDMYIYINGIGAAAGEYTDSNFKHENFVSINSEGCTVHLYSFKMYRTHLNPTDILNNWMLDMNPSDQINAYQKNDIYGIGQEEINYSKAVKQIPCLTIIGQLPTYKGDKKSVNIKFEGTENALYDFTLEKAEIDVQGTSSQYYPVKNWKFKKKDEPFVMANGEKISKYALADDQIPAKVFCLKADYMETSSTHNTVTANFANSMYDEKTPPQKPKNKTESEIERAEKTRTTIYGRPILVFYQDTETSPLRFGGKYNFNYDKGAEDVFGFFEDTDYEVIDCVEFRENRNDRCLLKVSDYTEIATNLSATDLEEFDEKSWIKNADGTVTSAYEWGRSFEFRYYYHRNETEESKPYEYLKAVTDWVVETDFTKADPNRALEVPYITDKGVANFLYDKNLNIVKFLDSNGNERRALDLGYLNPDELDYDIELIKTYITNEDGNQEEVSYYALAWDNNLGKEVYKFIKDTENYRLTKFKNELPEHFNEHFCLMYFHLMEMLGMIDSSTKNMFWATWGERHLNHPIESGDKVVIWYPIFYDMDTMMGINNTGKMNIPYNVEFDSPLEGSETGFAYNGYDNVFWNSFRRAYTTELNSLFRDKISDGTFSLDNMLELYENHSENFSEAIYNEDGILKIIDSYFKGYITNRGEQFPDWLHVYQGDRYYYRRFWLPSRFNYLLSKNFAGDYANDFISMRLNDPRTKLENQGKDIEVNYDFDIVTWKDQYTRIKYGGRSVVKRCLADEENTIEAPSDSYNDTETGIFGASNLKYIGNLANKYASTLELSAAKNLLELNIGSEDSDYDNPGLNSITFGSNSMLRKVNVQNCNGLSSSLGVSACPNIKEINARGTNIASVELPTKGILEKLYLPASIKNLTITNQPNLKEFELPSTVITYKDIDENGEEQERTKEIYNLETIIIENSPAINSKKLVECSINEKLSKLVLKDINWTGDNKLQDDSLLFAIKKKGEENKLNGETVNDEPILYGDCEVINIKDYLKDRLDSYFNNGVPVENLPELSKRYFRLTAKNIVKTHVVKFFDSVNETPLYSGIDDDRIIDNNQPYYKGSTPIKEEDWAKTYNFKCWGIYKNGELQPIIDLSSYPITEDTNFYAIYNETEKIFTINFYSKNPISGYYELYKEPVKFTYDDIIVADTLDDEYAHPDYALRFKGWSTIAGAEEAQIMGGGFIAVDENSPYMQEYYAVYTLDYKYRVTFVDYDNTIIKEAKIYYSGDNISQDIPTNITRDPDVQYVYTFKCWSYKGIELTQIPDTVDGTTYDIVYKAVYSKELRPYTITFVDWRDNLIESKQVKYSVLPTPPSPPIKEDTAQYDYEFSHWEPEITAVTGDATYKAIYSSTVKTYTVTWYNEDGTQLEKDENVPYGTVPSYNGQIPIKPKDAQYTYTFAGWHIDDTIPIEGNIDFYAIYSNITNTYTVTWKNYDGTVLEIDETVPYGEIPKYNKETPYKPFNDEFNYVFIGWDTEITEPIETEMQPTEPVKGDITYTAQFQGITRSYLITFIDYNGDKISSYEKLYGTDTIVPTDPTRIGYTFIGWSPNVATTVTGEVTYTAQYSINYYTIEFIDWNGTILSTQSLAYGTPTKDIVIPTPSRIGYDFKGWDSSVTDVTDHKTYTAQYKIQRFTIKFVDWNGSVLSSKEYDYGTSADSIVKPTVSREHYDFTGWSPAITVVTNNATYTAHYEAKVYIMIRRPTSSTGSPNAAFSNFENIYDDDVNTYATTLEKGSYSHYLKGFKFTIPTNATVKSIKTFVRAYSPNTGSGYYELEYDDFDVKEIIIPSNTVISLQYYSFELPMDVALSKYSNADLITYLNNGTSSGLDIRCWAGKGNLNVYDFHVEVKYTLV